MTDSSPGLHTIYAMFANANGLQSSPVSKNIKVIDTPTIISLGVNMYLEDNECFYGSVQVGNNAPIRKLFNNQNSLYISFYVAGEPSSTWFYENTTEYPNKYRYAINGEDISAKEWSDINVKSWHAGDATTGVGDLFEIILIPIDNEIDYDQASVQISVQLKNIVGESSIVTNDFIIQKNLSQSLFSNCSDVN